MERDDFQGSMKQPPHSMLAEQSVLGGLMQDANRFDDVRSLVSPDDFYRNEHRLIFGAMCKLAAVNQPLDAVTVSESLEGQKRLEEIGGLAYLAGLVSDVPGSSNIEAWSEIVAKHAQRRRLIRAGSQIIEDGYSKSGESLDEIQSRAERLVLEAAGGQEKEKSESYDCLVDGLIEDMHRRSDDQEQSAGIPTGLKELDRRIGRLEGADYVILAARPSMGKTSLVQGIAERTAENVGDVMMFSLDMPKIQLVRRSMSRQTGISSLMLRQPKNMVREEWERVNAAAMRLKKLPLHIDDRPGLTPREIRAAALRQHKKSPLKLVVVDYLQQVNGEGENKTQQVGNASAQLRQLAKILDCPVIALSQLSRAVEQRDNKRPRNSDLRESGGLEQDADIILFIYREVEYNPDCIQPEAAEIIIGKQRNGPKATVYAEFRDDTADFRDLPPDFAPVREQPRPSGGRVRGHGNSGFDAAAGADA